MEDNPNNAALRLGRWLHGLRQSTNAWELGIPRPPRARSPWLTQVELARLAGLTPRAYQGVEQGHRLPGPRVMEGIATALRMNDIQIAHMRRLTNPPLPAPRLGLPLADVRDVVNELQAPAFAYDHTWKLLASNNALRTSPHVPAIRDGINLLEWFFTADKARELFIDWSKVGENLIARLRATSAYYLDTTEFDQLGESLSLASTVARRLWREGAAVAAEPAHEIYRLRGLDAVERDCAIVVLQPAGMIDPSVRIAVHRPPVKMQQTGEARRQWGRTGTPEP